MARQKVLDDRKKTEICAMLTAGMSLTKAARHVGCDRRAIHRERQLDPDFGERVRQARMMADLTPHAAMRQFATKHWRAAAWMIDRDDRREEARRAKKYYTQTDLDNLAEGVKRILKTNLVLDPFDGPPLAEQIDGLFRQAEPGKTQPPGQGQGHTGPSVADSIRFLEKRFAARAAAAQEAEPNDPQPDDAPDAGHPPLESRLQPAPDAERPTASPPVAGRSPDPNVPAPGTYPAPAAASESQKTLPTPSPTNTHERSANVPGDRVPGSGTGRPGVGVPPSAGPPVRKPGAFPPTPEPQCPTPGDLLPHRRAERDAETSTNAESNGRVRRE